jgi:hypothetical protein
MTVGPVDEQVAGGMGQVQVKMSALVGKETLVDGARAHVWACTDAALARAATIEHTARRRVRARPGKGTRAPVELGLAPRREARWSTS